MMNQIFVCIAIIIDLLISAVSCSQCTDTVTVGSLGHGNTISEDKTYILAGYEVPSGATVVAWEFCYQRTDVASVTFYPGLWRITDVKGNGDTDYELVQSNAVTYDPSGSTDQLPCLMFNLSVTDRFTVSEESVVGLYSNTGAFLLRTNTDDAVTTYEENKNKSHIDKVRPNKNGDIDFNIAIRVYFVVNGSNDRMTAGSLDYDSIIIDEDRTYILAGYTVPCNGVVIAWEFCYQTSNVPSVTFYPGIWRIANKKKNGDTDYELIQSSAVTFKPSGSTHPCQTFTLSVRDQFIAPNGSVIGLYSNEGDTQALLLRTDDNDDSVTTFESKNNKSEIIKVKPNDKKDDVDYNIAIRVHLSKSSTTSFSTVSSSDVSSTLMPTEVLPLASTSVTSITSASTTPVSTSLTSDLVMPTIVTPSVSTGMSISVTSVTSTIAITDSVMSTSATSVMSTSVAPGTSTSVIAATPTRLSVAPATSTSVAPSMSPNVVPATSTSVAPAMSTSVAPAMSTSVTPVMSTSVASSTSTSVVPATSTSVVPATSTSVAPATSASVAPAMSTSVTPVVSTSETPLTSASVTTVTSTSVTLVASNNVAPVTSTSVISVMSTSVSVSVTLPTFMSTSITSNTSTNVMPVMPTISASNSTTIPFLSSNVTSGAQTSSDNLSSNAIIVIAGFVMVVVLCVIIVILIMLILWYQRRKKNDKNKQDVGGYVNFKPNGQQDEKGPSNHHYSVVKHGATHELKLSTIKDFAVVDYETIDNAGYYSSVDNVSGDLNGKPTETVPDMKPASTTDKNHPKMTDNLHYYSSTDFTDSNRHCEATPDVNSIVKHHSKLSNNDYESPPAMNTYETPGYEMPDESCHIMNSTEDNVTGEALPEDEQIYEDPGHNEEKIYVWFEEKKFRRIRESDIKTLQKLGSGEFGVVNLGLWSNGSADPVQVAVKTLNSQCSESDRVKFLREAAIMGQFVHNNVVQLHGVVTDEENMMIILEYMLKGDLRNLLLNLRTSAPLGDRSELKYDLLSYCKQIAAGISYLASKRFVHRDLAARNILVSSDDVCKIADFGMARDVSDDTYYITSGGKIPIRWTAPEALFYRKYSALSDVWSFGCVMYEIWSLGRKPFEGRNGYQYMEEITTGYRLPPPPGCPRAMYELMIQCWHPTARDRPTSGSISRTLQESDRALLTSSVQVTDDDVTNDNQSMMLGAPLTAGSQLYLDLQQRYLIK